jgi:hypothetical protein
MRLNDINNNIILNDSVNGKHKIRLEILQKLAHKEARYLFTQEPKVADIRGNVFNLLLVNK